MCLRLQTLIGTPTRSLRNLHIQINRSNSYNKTNDLHQFLKFIFGIELYMFRTVSLSIIRSLALYTHILIAVCTVLDS
jgi:hypothetical protein